MLQEKLTEKIKQVADGEMKIIEKRIEEFAQNGDDMCCFHCPSTFYGDYIFNTMEEKGYNVTRNVVLQRMYIDLRKMV